MAPRRAIVTGASRGIGRAIALRLAARGYRVLAVARSAGLLEELRSEAVVPHAADLRDAAACVAVVDAAMAALGGVDLLVNCAGATKRGDFLSLGDADMLDGFQLKFHAAVRLTRAAWPHLVASGAGHVVNISGVGGRTPSADFTIGSSVNSALMAFGKAMADRGRMEGVRVNCINPGPVETGRLTARIASFAQEHGLAEAEARAAMVKDQQVIRFGRPEEIAAAVAYLDGPEGGFFQGAVIDLDGGSTKGL